MHKTISTPNAPGAIGPYSQAILAKKGDLLFISGQIPISPISMAVESQEVGEQTKQVLNNLFAILKAAGGSAHNITKTTVYLKSMDDFAKVNQVYQEYFSEHHPARVCVEVARLPKDVLVEIDAIAVI